MKVNKHTFEVFEFAKKMEVEAKELYIEELKKTSDPGLRAILQMLIEAEQNHYEIFSSMQKEHSSPVFKTDLSKVKKILSDMKSKVEDIEVEDHSDFYNRVYEIEKKAEEFYRKEAEASPDIEVRKALNEIADEEHRHMILARNLKVFVSRPKQWVEDAEFNNMVPY